MSMLNQFFDYKPEVLALDEKALALCQPYFKQMEDIRDYNQLKMLKAFADTQMSSTDMLGTTGYGLWDSGRAKLEQIFAEVMGAEDALVRSQFQSGTHTLAVALFGLLRAGDTLLAATGRPYDTLEGVIGLDGKGKGTGTLMDYGIRYDEAPLKADFTPDYELIAQKAPGAKVCHIQRSRGYLQRNAFDLDTIRRVADTARAANPDIIVFVDNCYGEFTLSNGDTMKLWKVNGAYADLSALPMKGMAEEFPIEAEAEQIYVADVTSNGETTRQYLRTDKAGRNGTVSVKTFELGDAE